MLGAEQPNTRQGEGGVMAIELEEFEALLNQVHLERTCTLCDGERASETSVAINGECVGCDGAGYELTPFGERVMALVARRRGQLR
jgi:hypothetical protein